MSWATTTSARCAGARRAARIGVPADKDSAERTLVRHARTQDAQFVTTIGATIADCLNRDGNFTDEDHARRRGLALGRQGPDGMSRLSGWLDPETRSYLEAVTAAVRPADTSGTVRAIRVSATPAVPNNAATTGSSWASRRPWHPAAWDCTVECRHGDRHNDARRTGTGRRSCRRPRPGDAWAGTDRRRWPPAYARSDPVGRQRHSLPCGIRQSLRSPAVPRPEQADCHRRSSDDLLRPRPRLHET